MNTTTSYEIAVAILRNVGMLGVFMSIGWLLWGGNGLAAGAAVSCAITCLANLK